MTQAWTVIRAGALTVPMIVASPAQAQDHGPDASLPATNMAAEEAQPSVVPPVGTTRAFSRTEASTPGLAGDWLGLKPKLAQAGILLTSRYVSETAWNPAGGRRHDIVETGEFDIGLAFDMKRLAGLDGTVRTTVTYRRGHQLDQRADLGTLQEVQEIYGRGQTWRLTQFEYETELLRDFLNVKLGLTSPGEDFAAFSCSFQNLSFCGSQPGNVVGGYWYNWPIGQWGARARVHRGGVYAQIAVYEENPRNLDKDFLGHVGGARGALIPVELGVVKGGAGDGLAASYKIGGWLSTANVDDVVLNVEHRPRILANLPSLQRSSAFGAWVHIRRQVTGRAEKGEAISGLSLFFNLTLADRRSSIIDSQIVMGLFEKGVFRGIADDELGLGFARTHVNGRVARVERLAGKPLQGSEYAVELYYGFRPLGWLQLRPNLQWIHNAGGYRSAGEIGVVGLKALLVL